MNTVCLINGTQSRRERNSDGATVLPCGCAHTDILWLQMCQTHTIETDTRHAQARADHARKEPS